MLFTLAVLVVMQDKTDRATTQTTTALLLGLAQIKHKTITDRLSGLTQISIRTPASIQALMCKTLLVNPDSESIIGVQ